MEDTGIRSQMLDSSSQEEKKMIWKCVNASFIFYNENILNIFVNHLTPLESRPSEVNRVLLSISCIIYFLALHVQRLFPSSVYSQNVKSFVKQLFK